MWPDKPSQFAISQSSIGSRILTLFLYVCICLLFAGCSAVSSPNVEQNKHLFEQQELSRPYNRITLKKSLTIDALPKIRRSGDENGSVLAADEIVSHSDRVVATLGQSRDNSRTWFNMVTFHKFRLNVIRKYFFIVDDRVASLRVSARKGLRFNCEMVLEEKVLGKSYVSDNLKRIAILRYVQVQLRKDVKDLGDDVDVPDQYNKKLDVCGMLINQMLEMVLVKLESSPVLAPQLSKDGGVQFDHINFGKGEVLMVVEDDAVAVSACFGSFANGRK